MPFCPFRRRVFLGVLRDDFVLVRRRLEGLRRSIFDGSGKENNYKMEEGVDMSPEQAEMEDERLPDIGDPNGDLALTSRTGARCGQD